MLFPIKRTWKYLLLKRGEFSCLPRKGNPHDSKNDPQPAVELCDEDGLYIHYMSDEARIDERALFYLRTRGIAKADAQRMLLGTLTNSNYCYFTVAPEVAEVFGEGAGSPYLCHDNRRRRAEARASR